MRTKRGKVQETGEDNNPEVGAVDDVATIDLRMEQLSDTRVIGHGIKQRTNQKAIR